MGPVLALWGVKMTNVLKGVIIGLCIFLIAVVSASFVFMYNTEFTEPAVEVTVQEHSYASTSRFSNIEDIHEIVFTNVDVVDTDNENDVVVDPVDDETDNDNATDTEPEDDDDIPKQIYSDLSAIEAKYNNYVEDHDAFVADLDDVDDDADDEIDDYENALDEGDQDDIDGQYEDLENVYDDAVDLEEEIQDFQEDIDDLSDWLEYYEDHSYYDDLVPVDLRDNLDEVEDDAEKLEDDIEDILDDLEVYFNT